MVEFLSKIFKQKNVPVLVLITILFYLARTIFPSFKFLFIVSFLLLLGVNIPLVGKYRIKSFINTFYLPLFLFLIFIIASFVGTGSNVVFNEILNGVVLTILFFFIFNNVNTVKRFVAGINLFIKWFINIVFFVGVIALIKWVMTLKGVSLPFDKLMFAAPEYSFSLVGDVNFYSLYFLLSIVILLYLSIKQELSRRLFVLYSVVFLLNVILSFSRRGYIALSVIILFSFTIGVFRIKRKDYKDLMFRVLISLFITVALGVVSIYILRFQLYSYDQQRFAISFYLDRINKLINPDESLVNMHNRIWSGVESELWNRVEVKEGDSINLLYNGSFNQGLKYWTANQSNGKYLTQEIIRDTCCNYVRLTRTGGRGNYQLLYNGRELYYHKGAKYTIVFEYRVNQGKGIPFRVGWWYKNREEMYINNLPITLDTLEDSWVKCSASYIFDKNIYGLPMFLNSMQSGTIIDVRNIRLYCNKNYGRKFFSKQIFDKTTNIDKDIIIDSLSVSRLIRWKYAGDIWFNDYNVFHKIFGNGFSYKQSYGEKFLGDKSKLDYPHNPIISSFLYSGIIGGLFYIYFLIMVFYYYWKYRKYHMVFFFMYLITFFFMMFSGNSHFSVPVFTFLSLIPFLTKYYVEKEVKTNKIENE